MRRLRSILAIAGAVMLAALVVTGCASASADSSIAVASAYLDIRNNGRADELVSVQTSVGGKVQLRAPVARHSGILTMRTVADIPIPANTMTLLNPDTFHLLITGAGAMHDGKDIMLRLTFANAGTVTVLAMVTNPESGGSSYFLN
jgi:periplasmic copper chaperone A